MTSLPSGYQEQPSFEDTIAGYEEQIKSLHQQLGEEWERRNEAKAEAESLRQQIEGAKLSNRRLNAALAKAEARIKEFEEALKQALELLSSATNEIAALHLTMGAPGDYGYRIYKFECALRSKTHALKAVSAALSTPADKAEEK